MRRNRARVLDGNCSTLGDPMADFTIFVDAMDDAGLAGTDLKALNIPSMEEAAQIDRNVTGTAVPYSELVLLRSSPCSRSRGITQGIAGRIRDGTAANAKAIEFGEAHRAAVAGFLGIRAEGRAT